MIPVLASVLVMVQSLSAPMPPARVALDVEPRAEARLGPSLRVESAERRLRLTTTLSDCDPATVGQDPGATRLAASQDLVVCRATQLKSEPVGRAILWLGPAGIQATVGASRLYVTVRVPGF
jgi:hypothetical protein